VHQASGGAFAKTGTGTLTLTNANTYPGGTTLEDGSLFVNNASGSGTGTGAVQVAGGTFGGEGIIAGPVTIGPAVALAQSCRPARKQR
jgi:fibronectin-binding autotransporter adhesin